MTLKLRRVKWYDGSYSIDPEDYSVIDERGENIGHIHRTIGLGGVKCWDWSVSDLAIKNRWQSRVHCGRVASLEEAKAAFKAAWATCEPSERGA